MSAFASLTLQNNAAANVTFAPASIDKDGVARWLSNEAIYDAKKAVTMQVTYPKNGGSSVVRVKQKVVVPIMDTVDTSLKVADAYINMEFVLPKQASETVRLDLRKYADTLLQNAVTTAAVQNLENIY